MGRYYLSPPFDAGVPAKLKAISWEAETPFRTRVAMQVRTAKTESELTSAPWYGATGRDSTFETSGSAIPDSVKANRWMQYKAILASPSLINTPVLQSVSIEYQP